MRLPAFLMMVCCAAAMQGQQLDPAARELFLEFRPIRAIDNHAHVNALTGRGQVDDDQDALPCPAEGMGSAAFLTRPNENALYARASRALFDYRYNDYTPAHLRERDAARAQAKETHGDAYPAWVLDQVGTEAMLANRVAMGRGLAAPRFLWVPFDDALMYPLDNSELKAANADRAFFFGREEKVLRRYESGLGVQGLPPTLDQYVRKIVLPELAAQKRAGAVAIKFEAAYLRRLDFTAPRMREAEETYAHFVRGGVPEKAGYRDLQNYLIRAIAAEAGRLGLAVHFHTGAGCGRHFNLEGSDPVLLQSLFSDPSVSKTNFVMLHGGNLVGRAVPFLIGAPNVYVDFSFEVLAYSTPHMASILRNWLESYPEKVLFGSDVFADEAGAGWEEQAWVAGHNGRAALAVALAGMMADGEINHARALELGRGVLHDNAARLYSLPN